MMTATKLAKNHTSSTTATTTFEGRTEVDVRELLNRPNVKEIIRKVAENTTLVARQTPNLEEKQESQAPAKP